MKTILINGSERALTQENAPLANIINDISNEYSAESKAVSSIKIDGEEIPEDRQADVLKQPVNTLGTVEIIVSNPAELALETLTTLDAYTDRIMQNIDRAGTLYRDKNYVTADNYFMKAIDGLDLFVQTIGGIKSALRMGMNPKVALTEATLISIMTDLLDAKKQNNYVMLSELLLQDLLENMNEWKSAVFPAIRGRASS